ncbi:hypothetical protein ACFV3R_20280 [Streptomyces sp. NPDC059740]|uniref:hypothetical protein n=1 Tax=Streptomyces sp. NPDC059740 TaxID=3346926 RepID=UPI003660ACD7
MNALLVLLAATSLVALVLVPWLRSRGRLQDGRRAVGATAGPALDPAVGYGFVPPEELDVRLPGPDADLEEALEALRTSGDWRYAAQLLAATGEDGERRWQRVQTLAGAAVFELGRASGAGAAWLRSWRAEAPKDPGAAQTQAQFLALRAMRDPGSQDFRMLLEEARTVCREAGLLAPGSPLPYLTDLVVARGLGERAADYEALWSEVARRAPHHMGAHLAALPYWSQKWHGSRSQAEAFAERAASQAPRGTLLPALPLFAVYEHLPEANLVRGLYQSAVVERAIEGAHFALREAPADHPVAPHVRHLLAWFLVRAERYAEALEQLRLVDGHVGAVPWSYSGDPVAQYVSYRAVAVAGYESLGGNATTFQPPGL